MILRKDIFFGTLLSLEKVKALACLKVNLFLWIQVKIGELCSIKNLFVCRSACSQADFTANKSINFTSFSDSCRIEEMTTNTSDSCVLPQDQRLTVYGVLVFSTVLLHFLRGLLFYMICINASRVLHNRMFSNILHVPVFFFDTNPSGKYCCLF